MADLTRKTANLVDQNVFATTYTSYVTSANGIITFNSVTSAMSSDGITVDIPANTVFTCIPLEVTNGILSFRIRFEGETEQDRQMVYLYDSNGEPNTIAPVTLSFAVKKITIFWSNASGGKIAAFKNFMVNAGSEPLPYEPYGWVHSLRKLTTATEAVENPLYSDGTAITSYTIKGNTVQSGTPTPSNPVAVNGVGERTANLLNPNTMTAGYAVSDSSGNLSPSANDSASDYIDVSGFTTVYIRSYQTARKWGAFYDENKVFVSGFSFYTSTQTVPQNAAYMRVTITTANLDTAMVVKGSTAPTSYIPYGYEIPILNNSQTIDIYIGDLPLLKSLDGTAVDEISNGTLTRRVDSDGSVLPTPTTTQITMPTIPTTEGANSITVDTAVQPSEFTATWTGWHDSSVKEYDGTNWQ